MKKIVKTLGRRAAGKKRKVSRRKGGVKGSYTLEASMIIPIYLFMMVTAVAAGVDIYKEAESKQEQERVADLWMVDDFYVLQQAGAVLSGSDR